MSTDSIRLLWSVLAEASARAAGAAALAALVLGVTRTRAAGVRHAVWTSITVAMLAMPLLPHAVPPVRVAALPSADLWTAPAAEVSPFRPRTTVPARAPVMSAAPAAADRRRRSSHPGTSTGRLGRLYICSGLVASAIDVVADGWR